MRGKEVTLKGTWSRRDTSPEDISMMRRLSYRIRRSALMSDEAPPAVRFSLIAHHGTRSTRAAQDRIGTFEAIVRVDEIDGIAITTRKAVRRAKQILRWFLEDTTCRPPRLVFESDAVRWYR